jgi:hypothetical protein
MVQVLLFAQFLIPMASRCNMKVSLDLVSIEAAEDSTRIRRASDTWCLAELPLLCFAQLLMHVPQLLPARIHAVVLAQLVHALLHLLACPLCPVGRIVAEEVAGQGPVASRILHIDAQVGATHGYNDIEVDLHIVRHPLLDGEGLRRCAGEPARNFGPGEVDACEDQRHRPCRRIAALHKIRLFGFGCVIGLVGTSQEYKVTAPTEGVETRHNASFGSSKGILVEPVIYEAAHDGQSVAYRGTADPIATTSRCRKRKEAGRKKRFRVVE